MKTATDSMIMTNSYLDLPDECYATVSPQGAQAPQMFAWNEELAADLGLRQIEQKPEQKLNIFSGNSTLDSPKPVALAYAGHQFGHFSPQLGDGRALLLGELQHCDGRSLDLQLKGSGRTPFSRGGDGRSALGPVVREYLLSEAMHSLGVPTTRALAAVQTGEQVLREQLQPGGILTRVAQSHLRIGTFQFFAARGARHTVEALRDYALRRLYPELPADQTPSLTLLDAVASAQANLVAHWMSLGFIHGVMNTDNMTISGETIDYGPCAFMDEFEANKVFSSIDRGGRYAYDQQPAIAQWNLARFAESLLSDDDKLTPYEDILTDFRQRYEVRYQDLMRQKLGLTNAEPDDQQLVRDWLQHLEQNHIDFTNGFRDLANRIEPNPSIDEAAFFTQWRSRLSRQSAEKQDVVKQLNRVNPKYIPRNHQVEKAIAAANQNDFQAFNQLHEVLKRPFAEQPAAIAFTAPPSDSERVTATFCGT
ncbi:MAG: YdiU family protein [Woeseiaceae bacterium]